jgi:hypothetical protein
MLTSALAGVEWLASTVVGGFKILVEYVNYLY